MKPFENATLRRQLVQGRARMQFGNVSLIPSLAYCFRKSMSEIRILKSRESKKKPMNMSMTLSTISKCSVVSITPQDLEACHCVPSKPLPNNNVVQFTRIKKRDQFFEKERQVRLNNNFRNTSTLRIFDKDHSCPLLRCLLVMALFRQRKSGWKYVWSRNGKVCTRKSDNLEVITVEHECDLEKFRAKYSCRWQANRSELYRAYSPRNC